MKKLGTEPAFPLHSPDYGNGYVEPGISKRFYAACAAMQGIIASHTLTYPNPDNVADMAFKYADELVKQEDEQ